MPDSALRKHRLARSRRANKQDVVPTSGRDLHGALDILLPFHIREIDIVS
jgi:hypothetical protein